MKITGSKRILMEDFKKEDQALVSNLAYVLNPFLEQVVQAFSKNITVSENLNMEYKTVMIEVDANGLTLNTASFQTTINNISGLVVINISSDDGSYPLGAPFCSYTKDGKVVKIQHVTGLDVNIKYTMKVLVLGV